MKENSLEGLLNQALEESVSYILTREPSFDPIELREQRRELLTQKLALARDHHALMVSMEETLRADIKTLNSIKEIHRARIALAFRTLGVSEKTRYALADVILAEPVG